MGAVPVAAAPDASGGVTVGHGANSIRITAGRAAARGARLSVGDGSTVYRGADSSVSAVVEPTPTGAQIATVTTRPGADRFSYRVDLPDGATMQPSSDGGVDITRQGVVFAQFAAPWAKDANGRSLTTSYSLKGRMLTQTVETGGAVFPVVADPRLQTTASILGVPTRVKLWLSRSETEDFYRNRDYGVPVGVAAAAFCSAISGTILTGLCVAAIGYVTVDFTNNVEDAHEQHHCLTLEIGLPALVDWDHGDGQYCEHPS